jgi:hypothetical protein
VLTALLLQARTRAAAVRAAIEETLRRTLAVDLAFVDLPLWIRQWEL